MTAKDITTPLVHLYRGELGRMTMYRVRLDTTTNWAVGTSAAVISFVLGNPHAPPYVIGLAVLLDFAFVHLEARRFQRFAMVRRRVELLERGFYCELLGAAEVADWKAALHAHLAKPPDELTWFEAMGARLRRNYLWVFAALGIAWLLALDLEHHSLEQAAAVGPIGGTAVAAAVAGFGVFLLGWALAGRDTTEVRTRPEH